jgi:MOSC domain-containing protein YiiM
MFKGSVVSINITSEPSAPMVSVDEIVAYSGLGLKGDRYFGDPGKGHKRSGSGRDITLIELESIRALDAEEGIKLEPRDARRNIVTKGVPLNHLVNKEFLVGAVRLRGVRLCEPCEHLASLTEPGVLPGLVHRGGLRAEIITEGIIRVGDAIVPHL